MKRISYLFCALLLSFSAVLLIACKDEERPATEQETLEMNTGVTGSSAAVAGLLKPEDLGQGWYEGATNQFLRPQDISKSTACDGNRNYIKQEQSGLSAESQRSLNKLIGIDKPDISEQLRVFKSDDSCKGGSGSASAVCQRTVEGLPAGQGQPVQPRSGLRRGQAPNRGAGRRRGLPSR